MTEKKQNDSKARIQQEAVRLFARQGFARTGMRELAAQAGVNLAMINYFFGSKKELLKIILDQFFSQYLKIAQKELTAAASFDTKMKRFFKNSFQFFAANREYVLVAIAELPHDDPDITAHRAQWASQMMAVIEKEICRPLAGTASAKISAAAIGPLITSMMASFFFFAPVINQVRPSAYDDTFEKQFPELITQIFLYGVKGPRSHGKACYEALPRNGSPEAPPHALIRQSL